MKNYRTAFDETRWQTTPEGARFKVCEIDGKEVKLLEKFGPDLRHPDWRAKGHTGVVLAGEARKRRINRLSRGRSAAYPSRRGRPAPPGGAQRYGAYSLLGRKLTLYRKSPRMAVFRGCDFPCLQFTIRFGERRTCLFTAVSWGKLMRALLGLLMRF